MRRQRRAELSAIRRQTSKPFNLNFFCHTSPATDPAREAAWRGRLKSYYVELGLDPEIPVSTLTFAPFGSAHCDLVTELKPEVVSFHFGLPNEDLLGRVKAVGAKILSSATTVKEAIWLEQRGCDAIITQGLEAGGHRGKFLSDNVSTQAGTMALVPQVADAVGVPYPELANIPPGIEMSLFYSERVLIDPMRAQNEGLLQVLRDFPADVIIADNFLCGVMPMLLGQPRSERLCGTMFLHSRRDDGAPNFAGLPPASNEAEREEYAAISKEHDRVFYEPVRHYLNDRLADLGVGPLSTNVFHALVGLFAVDRAKFRISTTGFAGLGAFRRHPPHHSKSGPAPALGARVGWLAQSCHGNPGHREQFRFSPVSRPDAGGAGE